MNQTDFLTPTETLREELAELRVLTSSLPYKSEEFEDALLRIKEINAELVFREQMIKAHKAAESLNRTVGNYTKATIIVFGLIVVYLAYILTR